jgi:hypothetical protein
MDYLAGMTLVFAADDLDGQQVGWQAASLWLLILICPVGRPSGGSA